jgi:hypothetical protein
MDGIQGFLGRKTTADPSTQPHRGLAQDDNTLLCILILFGGEKQRVIHFWSYQEE